MGTANKLLQAASGTATADKVFVDEVFATFLYTGNATARSIVNGINLDATSDDSDGGLVWIKWRSGGGYGSSNNALFDTSRGVNQIMYSDSTMESQNTGTGNNASLSAFNSNGFSLGVDSMYGRVNGNNALFCSWTFKKQTGFFDIVSYTGNGSNRTISHNLGAVPAMMIIKRTNSSEGWQVYHFTLDADEYMELNSTNGKTNSNGAQRFNNTRPTSTGFTVGTHNSVNGNGDTYVAYLFAGTGDSDSQIFGNNSDQAIIKSAEYNGDGTSSRNIDVGFDPRFVMIKGTSSNREWQVYDVARGIQPDDSPRLFWHTSNGEQAGSKIDGLHPNGFRLLDSGDDLNGNGNTYIYLAIGGSNKEPTAATEVFDINTRSGTGAAITTPITTGFMVDFLYFKQTAEGSNYWGTRKTGKGYLFTNSTSAEVTNDTNHPVYGMQGVSDGYTIGNGNNDWNGSGKTYIDYSFKRATGFFDVVTYIGNNSSNRSISHGLGIAPELMLVKSRGSTQNWVSFDTSTGATKYMRLNTNGQPATTSGMWNNTAPTYSAFTVDGSGGRAEVNANGTAYIAYLFGTVAGVSKVGVYTGTGSNVDVDCGFSAGARLVLIKRNNDSGDWYLYDSARGIVAGNDSYNLLNSSADSVTDTDYIDPLNAGFTITSSAPAGLNASGGTYIFLAIA